MKKNLILMSALFAGAMFTNSTFSMNVDAQQEFTQTGDQKFDQWMIEFDEAIKNSYKFIEESKKSFGHYNCQQEFTQIEDCDKTNNKNKTYFRIANTAIATIAILGTSYLVYQYCPGVQTFVASLPNKITDRYNALNGALHGLKVQASANFDVVKNAVSKGSGKLLELAQNKIAPATTFVSERCNTMYDTFKNINITDYKDIITSKFGNMLTSSKSTFSGLVNYFGFGKN